MKHINLLPSRHGDVRGRVFGRRGSRRLIALLAVSFGWIACSLSQLHRLEGSIRAAEREVEPLRQRRFEIERATDRERMLASLRDPASVAAILAMISQVAPAEIALRSLVMDVPAPSSTAAAGAGARRRAGDPAPIRIQLDGMTIEGTAVASLVKRLQDTGSMRNVRVDDCRDGMFNNRKCSQFRLSMEMPFPLPAALAAAQEIR